MKTTILFLFLLAGISSSAQQMVRIDPDRINRVAAKFKDSLQIPGIAVGIASSDEIRYLGVFGFEDLDKNTPLTDHSVWPILSISKQFTTMACLKLAEEHKLSLQDKISGYFDNLPESHRNITVYHLLTHTSGLKDYINDINLYGSPWEKVGETVFTDTLNFKPGDAWSYCNTGFWMVARIIERITGMDYDQYLKQHFFAKLKMEHTGRVMTATNRSFVKGYDYRDRQFLSPSLDITSFRGQGDGEMTTTLGDLLRWNMAVVHGDLISKESVSRLWERTRNNHGETIEVIPNTGMYYGMGWFVRNSDGHEIVWTFGSGWGFSTTSQYLPEYDLNVIVFCNREQFMMADEIGSEIIRIILQP